MIISQGSIVADGTVPALLEKTGQKSLEQVFNKLTSTENLLARAERIRPCADFVITVTGRPQIAASIANSCARC